VTHDSLRYINILTYLLTYLLTYYAKSEENPLWAIPINVLDLRYVVPTFFVIKIEKDRWDGRPQVAMRR